MLWLWTSVLSALLLGFYDVAKKKAVSVNGGIEVLLISTAISSLFLSPFAVSSLTGRVFLEGTLFEMPSGNLNEHLFMFCKSLLVTGSWMCGIIALKHLPLTTVGIVKASRPVFVLLGCMLIFSEKLNFMQWGGIIVAIVALTLLGRSSRTEGISFKSDRWVWCLFGSVLFGVISALLDKYFLHNHNPIFVQAWCNVYITLILIVTFCLTRLFACLHRSSAIAYVECSSKNISADCSGRKTTNIVDNGISDGPRVIQFHWDWSILMISIFLTVSDFLYFYSLSCDGSMLSVVSMLRRSSVVVTFICGAIFFKERNLRAKGLEMLLLLAGMALLLLGSYM